ncbi:MAG: pyridoxamine 5'-phosphate oxidase family protein [Muribaculaceae bacterium]|nr:pyridoxamine 5'-phosphate oxidase family protein [Muribaculaceae bacterium]
MRRFRQLLSVQSAKEILNDSTNGVLSLMDTDGEPYGVPINYVYDGDKAIYFHSAVAGRKLDCVAANSRASFCVVAQDQIVPAEFTSYFRSVIVSGEIQVVSDQDEIIKGLRLLCQKYSPGIDPTAEITRGLGRVAVLRLDIESLTGKEAIELVKQRPASE